MVWYSPRSWFRKTDRSGLALYCDNPQCKVLITDKEVAYSEEFSEVYHPDECPMFAAAQKVFKSNTMEAVVLNIEYISREKALKLLAKGKLRQSKLEEKIS